GYSEDELTSGVFLDITHPDDVDSDLEQTRRMFAGEIPGFKIEKRFIHKNGDIVWTTLTANIMREESGATQYGIGLIEDITARKRAESAKLAAQRQASAIQSANVELTRSLDTSAVIQTLFAHLQHLVRYDCACIYLQSNGDQFVIDQMQWIERWADPPIARESLNVAVRILPGMQAALENRQTYVAPDTTQIPGWATLHSLAFVRSWLAVPLAARDDIIGLYALMRAAPEPFDTEDQRLAESLAAQAAVAIQNARLYDQVTSANLRLRELSQELAAAQDSERRRIALELHDEAGQALTALKVQLQLLREDTAGNNAGLDKRLAKAVSIVERTDEQIRLLAHALRPPALDTLGLELTLENYCREFAANTKIDIHFVGMDVAPIDDAKSLCFYRTVQEALNNATRHSGADRIDVRLSGCDGVMTLEVEDNGRGIRTGPLNNGRSAKGIGLSGMRDRLELLGGGLTISSEKGRGTLLTAYLAIDGETK
ncbi:MAG: GAF domain-containing protein, partial [Methyloligellaceae bacterium]